MHALVASVVGDVIDDLTSRQALAGAASVIAIAISLVTWWWWSTSTRRRRRRDTEVAVLVTGSRGKSSTVRALHAAFTAAGWPTYAKTTGTAAAELPPDAPEHPTSRVGQVSVLEVLRVMRSALRGPAAPRALVFECMAVKPDLISLVAREMLEPNVVVITNVQVDHLEDEGSSLDDIAASMASAITPGALVVTGEDRPGPLGVIGAAARAEGARFVHVTSADVPTGTFERLPYVHPQNVSFVLAVTRSVGIDDETAITGMADASKEPGEFEVWRRDIGGVATTYLDLGAINDPRSLLAALDGVTWPEPPDARHPAPHLALVVGRWDRPLRDLAFAGSLDPAVFDAVVLTGGPVHPMRHALVDLGWPADRVCVLGYGARFSSGWRRTLTQLVREVLPDATDAVLVALENEHDPVADRVRAYFRTGTRLDAHAAGSRRSA